MDVQLFEKRLASLDSESESERDREKEREHLRGLIASYTQQRTESEKEIDRVSRTLFAINESDTERKAFYAELHRRNAERLRALCERSGGVCLKIAHRIAAMGHVLPAEYYAALRSLSVHTPPSPLQAVRCVLESDLGRPLEELFDSFDLVPLRSSAFSQVHVAYKDGAKLAVKVQHEGLRESVAAELFVITEIARFLELVFPSFRFDWFVRDVNATVPQELDFQNELRNIHEAKRMLKQSIGSGDIVIPKPVESKSSSRVLTTSFEEGVGIAQIRDISKRTLFRCRALSLVMDAFAEPIFDHGFVHSDPHETNILVRAHPMNPEKPQLVLLDHGLYRTVDEDFRRDYARLWRSIFLLDRPLIEHYSRRLGAGDTHDMLSKVLMMKSFGHFFSDNASKLKIEKYVFVNSCNLTPLPGFDRFHRDNILAMLDTLPSNLVALLHGLDGLRHLDHLLDNQLFSGTMMGAIAQSMTIREEVRRLMSDSDMSYWQFGTELYRLISDCSSVLIRLNQLHLASAIHEFQERLRK